MFFLQFHPPTALPVSTGLPWLPAAEQYWAVMVWLILPSIAAIWAVYLRKEERLRNMRRQVRRLEAKLDAAIPGRIPVLVDSVKTIQPPVRRPSTLTAQILVNPAAISDLPEFVSGTTQPV